MPQKKARAEPIYFAEQGEAEATKAEVIFWALLLCVTHRGRVNELDTWAKKAILEEPQVECDGNSWKPSPDRWARDKLFQAPSIFSPLIHAHKRVAWTEGALDAVGLAMRAWRGDGYVDGLTGVKLKDYIDKPRLAARIDRKTAPPPRYRSKAVVRVARMLLDHGTELRRLLNLEEDSADAKPMHIVLKELEARNKQLEAALAKESASARRLQDAWCKAAGRLKEKNARR